MIVAVNTTEKSSREAKQDSVRKAICSREQRKREDGVHVSCVGDRIKVSQNNQQKSESSRVESGKEDGRAGPSMTRVIAADDAGETDVSQPSGVVGVIVLTGCSFCASS